MCKTKLQYTSTSNEHNKVATPNNRKVIALSCLTDINSLGNLHVRRNRKHKRAITDLNFLSWKCVRTIMCHFDSKRSAPNHVPVQSKHAEIFDNFAVYVRI